MRKGNAAYGAGLALLMAGVPEAREWLRRGRRGWRESWQRARRLVGPADRRAEGAAARRRRGGGGGARPLDARASARRRPSRRSAATRRRSRCCARALGGRAPCRRVASRPRRFPPRRSPTRSPTLAGGRLVRLRGGRRGGGRVVRDREEYLEDAAVADTVLALQALAATARDRPRPPSLTCPSGTCHQSGVLTCPNGTGRARSHAARDRSADRLPVRNGHVGSPECSTCPKRASRLRLRRSRDGTRT